MLVRFGFVAMSLHVKNASPSKTMTVKAFRQIPDRKAALKKLARIARENLRHTQRILYHCIGNDIRFYRFSSRWIPLAGHELVRNVNFIKVLRPELQSLGSIVRENEMRVGFHPDHFTVLNSPHEKVWKTSVEDLWRHVRLLKAMGLPASHKCNIHIGGVYGNKAASGDRFKENFARLHPDIQSHLCLENDDKSFTAKETLDIAESCQVPMVLDIHHHRCNHDGETLEELWPRVVHTWNQEPFPPKIHVSSPRSESDFRRHADYIDLNDLLPFLCMAKKYTDQVDVMIEAKKKDESLFHLMEQFKQCPEVTVLDQASIRVN
ncbi:UV DNA damage repair endonuclease UvsE [Paludifilum halophilum]|uniref:UV damage endonuclease UvsE n=1 Tax=Paludifilum halophilum TaxID=1642702 RepID=A0A235B5G6_9BACL|nr:UV DNA damage repair endonuclease UvsE [Paludifilum halophilum]OYD07147.1 UV damage endonuclease UvsE [Paludifilum halophilum]